MRSDIAPTDAIMHKPSDFPRECYEICSARIPGPHWGYEPFRWQARGLPVQGSVWKWDSLLPETAPFFADLRCLSRFAGSQDVIGLRVA